VRPETPTANLIAVAVWILPLQRVRYINPAEASHQILLVPLANIFQGMVLPLEQGQPLDLADIGLLRPHTVVPHSDDLPDLIEQFGLVPCGRVRYADNTLE
jgi:hypothetical protein